MGVAQQQKLLTGVSAATMSEEQLKAFLEKVKADTSLQEKLKAASDADAVVSIAKEEGFSISADDIKAQQSELSDEELEGVAGGAGAETVCGDY
ncbi:Nitrogen fixation protein of unknown function [Prochlorococcus marinus str. MIT 1342]|nr:Nitrogen fixation protein of unknown function [Prochlorococcus marinus str. MIT 1342]